MRSQLIAVAILTAVAQLTGFAKLWVVAKVFGVGPELDGYNLALVAPSMVGGVVSAAIQTGLFPVRARLAHDEGIEAAEHFERAVLLGVTLLGLALATVLWLFRQPLMALVAPGASVPVREALASVWPYGSLLIALNAPGDAVGYLLAMRNRYYVAAAAPIGNALVGVGVLLSWPAGGSTSLAVSTAAGLAVQVGTCLVALRAVGFRLLGAVRQPSGRGAEWTDFMRLSGWILPGVVFVNLSLALPPVLLSHFGDGAVSSYGYAFRLHSFLVQSLVMTSSPILLSRFAELVAQRDEPAIRHLLERAAWWSVVLGVAAVVAVWALGVSALECLFSGRFDAAAAQRVATHWLWLSAGLGASIFNVVLTKLWQGRGQSAPLSILYGSGLLALVAGTVSLQQALGETALPAAVTLSGMVFAGIGWFWERRFAAGHWSRAQRQ
jgi:peptidoglycan biosynthesis protein MviN/MurJ (putative lipid II flippase)